MLLGRMGQKSQQERLHLKSAPAALVTSRKPKKRKQWSDESIHMVVETVKNASIILQVATLHAIPRKCYKTKFQEECTTGGTQSQSHIYLLQKRKIWLESAKVGYDKSHQQVKFITACGIHNKGHLDADKVLSI